MCESEMSYCSALLCNAMYDTTRARRDVFAHDICHITSILCSHYTLLSIYTLPIKSLLSTTAYRCTRCLTARPVRQIPALTLRCGTSCSAGGRGWCVAGLGRCLLGRVSVLVLLRGEGVWVGWWLLVVLLLRLWRLLL